MSQTSTTVGGVTTVTAPVNQFVGQDIQVASASGTLGFFGGTPVVKTTSAGSVTGFVAGSGTASKSDSVWAGTTGSTTYTVGDLVTILKAYGLITA